MKKSLSLLFTFCLLSALLFVGGCGSLNGKQVLSDLNSAKFLEKEISTQTKDLSLKWESSPLSIKDVTVLKQSSDSNNKTTTLNCKITVTNQIMNIVRYYNLVYKTNNIGVLQLDSFTKDNESNWELALTIPSEKHEIDEAMFKGNTELTAITLPSTISDIYASAFEDCINLQSVTVSDQVAIFVTNVFKNCPRLKNINIGDNAETFLSGCFDGDTSLVLKKLPAGTTFIGSNAFRGCKQIQSLVFPDNAIDVLGNSFSDCTALKSVHFGRDMAQVDPTAFTGCTALTDMTVAANNTVMKMDGKKLIYTVDNSVILTIH